MSEHKPLSPTTSQSEEPISRRSFVKTASLAATALTTGLALNPISAESAKAQPAPAKPMIGFQAEVAYVLQYGIARFLDDVQTRASVNTLILHGTPFEASWAGLDKAASPPRQLRHRPPAVLPRHQNAAATPRIRRLQSPRPPCRRSPPRPKNAVSKSSPWMEEDNRPRPEIKGMEDLYEVDLYDRRTKAPIPAVPASTTRTSATSSPPRSRTSSAPTTSTVCSADPSVRDRSATPSAPGTTEPKAIPATPPASACTAPPKPRNKTSTSSASTGLPRPRALHPQRPRRQAPARRILRRVLAHPPAPSRAARLADLLVRQHARDPARVLRQSQIPPARNPIGYHIWQNISFNPIYRAEQDYRPYTEFADFIKPAIYDNPAGERMTSLVRQPHSERLRRSQQTADARLRVPRHGPERRDVCADHQTAPSPTISRN